MVHPAIGEPHAKTAITSSKAFIWPAASGSGAPTTTAIATTRPWHASGAPFALLNFDDEGGEIAATHDLLERTDVRGRVITLDALYTTRKTARTVTERCGADYVLTVKGSPETLGVLRTIDWERDATGSFAEDLDKVHGRLERRSISVLTPPKGLVNYPGVRQVARVTRDQEPLKKGPEDAGKDHTETIYLITSLDAGAASPEELLRLNRGHWCVDLSFYRDFHPATVHQFAWRPHS